MLKTAQQKAKDQITFDVGKRLRDIRTGKGISQRKLALLAGVTNGLISMIEQNRTSPSVATLKLILQAIPMTYGEFFSVEDLDAEEFVFRKSDMAELNPGRLHNDGLMQSPSGSISFRQVCGSQRGHRLQMLFEHYEPGADTGEELYTHEGEETGIVISGQIELSVGSRVAILEEGDGYFFDSRKPHRFRNVGAEVCSIVSACTPPTF